MAFSRAAPRFSGRLPPAAAHSPKFAPLFTTASIALAKVNVYHEDVLLSILFFRDLFRTAKNKLDCCTKKEFLFF